MAICMGSVTEARSAGMSRASHLVRPILDSDYDIAIEADERNLAASSTPEQPNAPLAPQCWTEPELGDWFNLTTPSPPSAET